jgi:hypothetical protein
VAPLLLNAAGGVVMKSFIVLIVILLSGCASLSSQVRDKVVTGDSQADILDKLGNPNEFKPMLSVQNGEIWIYQRSGDICAISFVDRKVDMTQCEQDPNYVGTGRKVGSAFASILGGASQGGQSNRTISCTSTNYGFQTQTTCN